MAAADLGGPSVARITPHASYTIEHHRVREYMGGVLETQSQGTVVTGWIGTTGIDRVGLGNLSSILPDADENTSSETISAFVERSLFWDSVHHWRLLSLRKNSGRFLPLKPWDSLPSLWAFSVGAILGE